MSLEKTVVKWGREFLDMWVQRGILPTFWGSSMSQISGMLHPGLGGEGGRKKRQRERGGGNKVNQKKKGFIKHSNQIKIS